MCSCEFLVSVVRVSAGFVVFCWLCVCWLVVCRVGCGVSCSFGSRFVWLFG